MSHSVERVALELMLALFIIKLLLVVLSTDAQFLIIPHHIYITRLQVTVNHAAIFASPQMTGESR